MSYSQRAWRETMRDLGGHAERVGLALEQLADGEKMFAPIPAVCR